MINIYTDGSFRDDTITWAFVAVLGNEVVHQDNGVIQNPKPDLVKIRNIAGETKAVMQAVVWAQFQHHKEITINHDYTGLSKWVKGEWKAKNYFTQQYANWMKRVAIKIHFRHVKGHSGNTFNEIADRLAKEALEF